MIAICRFKSRFRFVRLRRDDASQRRRRVQLVVYFSRIEDLGVTTSLEWGHV